MYINSVSVKSIRAIKEFDMSFPDGKQPGWHVIIGDNGSGKSSIIRSIAMCLIGPYDSKSLRLNLHEWLPSGSDEGIIELIIKRNELDSYLGQRKPLLRPFKARVTIKKDQDRQLPFLDANVKDSISPANYIWSNTSGWFSAGFGPFRRFTGGDQEWEKVFYSDPRAAAHLSVFGEDVALTEAIDWLKKINYKFLEKAFSNESDNLDNVLLNHLKSFLNEGGLLPHGTKLKSVTSEGVVFVDGNGYDVDVTQLSDGFRSLLSLTFELLRQLIRTYGQDRVFANFSSRNFVIDLPGVVLIDEVDAHLHPSWQNDIGKWFTKYFPNIQFIVTTHSPIICRACEKGSIWKLPSPGTEEKAREITGPERDKLIFGNILDQYGTGDFGVHAARSLDSSDMATKLAELNNKKAFGIITPEEEEELNNLRKVLTTDDTTDY